MCLRHYFVFLPPPLQLPCDDDTFTGPRTPCSQRACCLRCSSLGPSAGPAGLWDSVAQGFNNLRPIRNNPQTRAYLLPSPTGGMHRSDYLQ